MVSYQKKLRMAEEIAEVMAKYLVPIEERDVTLLDIAVIARTQHLESQPGSPSADQLAFETALWVHDESTKEIARQYSGQLTCWSTLSWRSGEREQSRAIPTGETELLTAWLCTTNRAQ